MQEMLENPAFKLYALSAAVLALHLLGLAFYTGRVRAKNKVFVYAEDAATFKGAHGAEHADVERVKKAHMNALENAVPFFVIGLLYALTASKTGAEAYFGVFVAMRILHSIFYVAQKQPFRTISFAIGAVALIGMGVHVIRYAVS